MHEVKENVSLFSLIAITIASITSIMGVVVMSQYGMASIFYYAVVIVAFYIPSALISTELASSFPHAGGIYYWCELAFGKGMGFFVLWSQWISVVFSFPFMGTFVGALLAYAFFPSLTGSHWYAFFIILIGGWFSVISNCFGTNISVRVSTFGAILTTALPVVIIAIFSLIWLLTGHHSQAPLHLTNIVPHLQGLNTLSLLAATVFMFVGIEFSAVFINKMKNPTRDYPLGILIASIVIILSSVVGSLCVAVFVSTKHMSLIIGIMQAFGVFTSYYHLGFIVPMVVLCIAMGIFAASSVYLISLSRSMSIAAKSGLLPQSLSKLNKRGAPQNVLILLGIMITVIACIFLVTKKISTSYWIIQVILAQTAILRYIVMFMAAIRLRKIGMGRGRQAWLIPGGLRGVFLVASIGIVVSIVVVFLGFFPPTQLHHINRGLFEGLLCSGLLLVVLLPFIVTLGLNRKQNTRARMGAILQQSEC